MSDDATTVEFQVQRIKPVEHQLDGFRVTRRPGGKLGIDLPAYRGADGAWRPAVVLPPELHEPIGRAILDEIGRV